MILKNPDHFLNVRSAFCVGARFTACGIHLNVFDLLQRDTSGQYQFASWRLQVSFEAMSGLLELH
jgi:hypothetical protein